MASNEVVDDDIAPEPVYFSLMETTFKNEVDTQILGVGEDEEDEPSDTELEIMDLTAPPSQA